jgi:homoserine O-acetyltransferase
VLLLATTAVMPVQNIAFQEVGQAIMADPDWQGGAYYNTGRAPDAGLAVARMAAHITYLSEETLSEKFGRRLQDRDAKSFGFGADFQVESYLRYQGSSFTGRFDANSYLYITRAMSYFDLTEERWPGSTMPACPKPLPGSARAFVWSASIPTGSTHRRSRKIAHAVNAAGAPVSFMELAAPWA